LNERKGVFSETVTVGAAVGGSVELLYPDQSNGSLNRSRSKLSPKKHRRKTGSNRNGRYANIEDISIRAETSRKDILAFAAFADVDEISNQPASFSEDIVSPSKLQSEEMDSGDSTSARMASYDDSKSTLTSPSALSDLSCRLKIPRADSPGPGSDFATGYSLGLIGGVRSWVSHDLVIKVGTRLIQCLDGQESPD
jgi:hypothetical protein